MDHWVREAQKQYGSKLPFLASILYGSRGRRGEDVRLDSDVDIMCFVRDALHVHSSVLVKCGSTLLDVYYTSPELARKALCRTYSNNANYMLNALLEGRIIMDPGQVVAPLLEQAWEMKRLGPPELTSEERCKLLRQVEAALRRIDALLSVRNATALEVGLIEIRCFYQFQMLFYGYCRIHRIWASSIALTMRWAQQHCSELYESASLYLRASSVYSKRDALKAMLVIASGDVCEVRLDA